MKSTRKARAGFVAACSVLACLTAAVSQAFAADVNTSPGKKAVYQSVESVSSDLLTHTQIFPTAVIEKGKAKQVLVLTATVYVFAFEDRRITLTPLVNGYFFQPSHGQTFSGCPFATTPTCALSGTWVADIDALEAAAPGVFVGQPLNVTLTATDEDATGNPRSVKGTLVVKMEKK